MTTTKIMEGATSVALPPSESPADSKAFNIITGAVYGAALLSTGYALFDALVTESARVGELTALGPLAPYIAALAGVLVIECFAIVVANLSTAARLAGRRAIVLRLIPAAGVLYSGFLNVTAHWADSKVIAIFLPGVGALGLVVWLMRVEHKYRARFEAIKAERDAIRNARRHPLARSQRALYVLAKGPIKSFRVWRARTITIGDAAGKALEARVLATIGAPAEIAKHAEPVRATAAVGRTVVDRMTAGALTEATEERPAIERRPAPAGEPTPIAVAADRAPAPKPSLRAVGGQPSVEEMLPILHKAWKGSIPRGAYEAVTDLTGVSGQGKIAKALKAYREQYAA